MGEWRERGGGKEKRRGKGRGGEEGRRRKKQVEEKRREGEGEKRNKRRGQRRLKQVYNPPKELYGVFLCTPRCQPNSRGVADKTTPLGYVLLYTIGVQIV